MDRTVYPGSRIEGLPKTLQTPAIVIRWLATDVVDRVFGRRDWLVTDVAEWASGRRDRFTPPIRLQHVPGSGDFRALGETSVHYLQALTDLKATDRVLDIGSGNGRTARVLTRELRSPGSYDGFDINREVIAWCQRRYRRTHAPFRFKHADLHNTAYNPDGRHAAADYRFPYPDAAFDLVFAFSVLTHLMPESAERYISEASRVLASGGRMLLTWFLLTDAPAPAPEWNFHSTDGPAAIADPDNAEAAVAYPEQWVRERITANKLTVREPIQYGSWRGTPSIPYQDLVVIHRA